MKLVAVAISIWMTMSLNAQHILTLDWDFFHPTKKEWMELGEKGSVQERLIDSGELPDPFYGKNEEKFGWLEEHKWEFKSIIVLHEEEFNYDYMELEFGNIDTYGKVFINGKEFFQSANAFIPHRKQAKDFLKVGANEITVVITPPVMYHAETWDTANYHLPAPNDVHDIAIAPYTRKPQYQFGWDWALRMNTIGFNKRANIHLYDGNRIVNETVNVESIDSKNGVAKVLFGLQLAVPSEQSFIWEVEGLKQTVRAEGDWVYLKRAINDPILWWPKGQGDPHIYKEEVVLIDSETEQEIYATFKYGIRTSELVQEEDEWGTSYYFKINGRKVFCKGGDYIPQDIFPARVEDKDIEKVVETMAASNFNMVRVWGGGYYPDDVFFETCDELGLMVWQDLMFACAMYPGDDQFIANISEEFNYQVPRIAGHPSVVQFNGNNEVEVAWGNWGFQIKYGLYGKSAKEIEASYDRVFKKTAPEIIEKYSSIPYIHTSPLSNWGKMELYNHGSQHYWGVWHGKDPIQDFGKKVGRFNAEYGFQSFPEYSTLLTFSDTSQWDLSSDVMKHHQKSYVGNDMILKHAKKLYGVPEDFETFVYYSQLTQAMAVSMAVAGHRVDFPRCGGTLYWQVNDCWPAPTWSSLDYFGNWKALQYRIRDDYEEVAVVETYDDLKKVNYHLVSGKAGTFEVEVSCVISNEKGKLLKEWKKHLVIDGMTNEQLISTEELTEWAADNIRISFDWNVIGEAKQTRSFDRFLGEWKTAKCNDVKLSAELIDETTGEYEVTITTKKYLRDLWLYCDQPGAEFDRNFVSLEPGEHTFNVIVSDSKEDVNFDMRWR